MISSASITKYSLKITLPYLLVSGLWILFSDRLLAGAITDIDALTVMQTYKGWFFVTMSGALVYGISRRYLSEIVHTSSILHKSEQALSESQRVMATLHANLPGFAYRGEAGQDRNMQFVSDGCLTLTGYRPDEFTGHARIPYSGLILAEDREQVIKTVSWAVADREPFQIEYRLRHKDGSIKWIWEQGCGVDSAADPSVALEGYVSDITEKKRLQEQLRTSERLEHVGQAASTIIHDLKNPMQVILGHVELLQRTMHQEKQLRHLGVIESQVQTMLSMSRELLDYARGEISLELSTIHVQDLLQRLVDTYQPTFLQAGIGLSFTWRQDPDASPETQLDRDRIWRALMNLIGNAREAIKGEGQIRLRSWTTKDQVCIEVQDDGPGIPKNIQSEIFNAFVTHGKSGGTGLGLAITKKIIESHRGTISFTSDDSVGTTFTITLPRQNASPATKAQQLARALAH